MEELPKFILKTHINPGRARYTLPDPAGAGPAGARTVAEAPKHASVVQTLTRREQWIPAFAGMTRFKAPVPGVVIPAKAGIHCQCLNRRNTLLVS
jgi:hypothetical protein